MQARPSASVTGSGPVAALARALSLCNNIIVVFAVPGADRGAEISGTLSFVLQWSPYCAPSL